MTDPVEVVADVRHTRTEGFVCHDFGRLGTETATAALTALREAGYWLAGPDEVVVPREATIEMIHAGELVLGKGPAAAIHVYRAMLEADND